VIEVRDVVKQYGSTRVLGPVSLRLRRGGITALVGPNGAGKSTLLSIVGRLAEPTSGSVSIDGHDVQTTPSAALAKIVAILRQENYFITRLTVRQLVAFGRFPHSRGRLTAHDHQVVDQALEFLDLTDLQGRFLDALSGGQRQRAYVAMVLAQDTDYLLLDEPLNNLDMRHAVAIMKQLRRAADELGKTMVVVIHDINFAAAYADHIVALREGQVIYDGTPAEVMRQERLEDIFNTPVLIRSDGDYPVAVYFR
jgi:iron complex transport system ATP-binding protein